MTKLWMLLVSLLFGVTEPTNNKPQTINLPAEFETQFETFEPSATLYLPDLGKFLVGIDDTDKKDRPYLFLMSKEGIVESNPILVQGLEKMTDIESLSQDEEGNLYILSSLGLSKGGKNKPERNLFVRAKRLGREITVLDSIDLRTLLLDALVESNNPTLKGLSEVYENELDVEASFVMNKELYVGLKNPQPEVGTAIILNLGQVDKIFDLQSVSKVDIWQTIDFQKLSEDTDLLSDMVLQPQGLLLTSSTEDGDGKFWRYDFKSRGLTLLSSWTGYKSEAIAVIPNSREALILFDQNTESPRYCFRNWKD